VVSRIFKILSKSYFSLLVSKNRYWLVLIFNNRISLRDRKLIFYRSSKQEVAGEIKLSFGRIRALNGVVEALGLGLMLILVLTIFYVDVSWTYKLGIGLLIFAIIFLVVSAVSVLNQQREMKRNQA
jgi:hypothetical protein